jgi:hypothetical protein
VCRAERRRDADRRCKRNKRKGLVRPLGSLDTCEICGGEYEVKGGLQRYCPDCACAVAAETDREQGLAYYEGNKETINPKRRSRRRQNPDIRVCAICGKEFSSTHPRKKTCSKACGKELLLRLNRQYHRDGRRKRHDK